MKRGLIYLVFIFSVFTIINTNTLAPAQITGEVITGEAIGGFGMNITVTALPTLTLINPKNQTYLTNVSLLLNYSSNSNNIEYNLDNLANTSISSLIYFNTSKGSHTLYLYANNTNGKTMKNVSFFINSTRFVIVDDEYETQNDTREGQGKMKRNTKKGTSTDFLDYSYEELQNLSNIIFDNIEDGKILFNQVINITNDENPSDNRLDLNTHTNISNNRIEINSSALPNFNKSATLWLYNLTFPSVRILKDGSVCPLTICTQESYTGGALKTLKFNVTEFSIYSAEESPIEESPPPGGGGGRISKKIEATTFEVDKELIKIQLKIGEKLTIPLTITNTYSTSLDFNIESNLDELPVFSETEFSIEKQEYKEILLSFHAKEDLEPGIYPGKIIIKTGNSLKEIPVIIEIKTKKIIFDVSLDIPPKYKEIFVGEDLLLQVTIFNLGEVEEASVLTNYLIKDFDGNIVFSQKETVKVKDQASFSKTIKIPKNLNPEDYVTLEGKIIYSGEGSVKFWDPKLTTKATDVPNTISPGDYVVGIQIIYEDSVGTSSDIFKIKLRESFLERYGYYVIFILIIAILAILIIITLKRESQKIKKTIYSYKRKTEQEHKKLKEKQIRFIKKNQKTKRIKDKITALEKAFAGGHISKNSYKKAKKRIKDLLGTKK